MGLDTTHGAWHGAYSAFMRWRINVAKFAGMPPLEFMEGFFENSENVMFNPLYSAFIGVHYSLDANAEKKLKDELHQIGTGFPIKWDALKPSPLHELLYHSDCEGDIPWENCKGIADALTEVLANVPTDLDLGGHIGNFREKTQTFIDGLMKAYNAKENLEFH